MTTFQIVLTAIAIFIPGAPLASYFAQRAGIPEYGCNPDQKPGWTILYVLTIFPTTLAGALLAFSAFVWLVQS